MIEVKKKKFEKKKWKNHIVMMLELCVKNYLCSVRRLIKKLTLFQMKLDNWSWIVPSKKGL